MKWQRDRSEERRVFPSAASILSLVGLLVFMPFWETRYLFYALPAMIVIAFTFLHEVAKRQIGRASCLPICDVDSQLGWVIGIHALLGDAISVLRAARHDRHRLHVSP